MKLLLDWLQQHGVDGGSAALAVLAVKAAGILLAVIAVNFVLRRVLARLAKGAEKTPAIWDDVLFSALRHPVSWLAWVLGATFVLDVVRGADVISQPLPNAVPAIRTIGVFFCITWFLVRLIQNAKVAFLKRKEALGAPVDRTAADGITQLLRIVVIVVASLLCLQSLHVPLGSVLALGGVGGLAVGLAAKDMLANFFGGLMIHLDRPFAVGDWVRSPDKQIEGTVEEIGWRVTRIRTFDKRPLYVPNSVFTTITVENPSRMTNRRINETIGVRYDDIGEVAGIVSDIRAMLMAHPEIDQSQTLIVNFLQFNEFSLDIMVYTFTRTTVWVRFHEVKQDVLLKIADIIAAHGAEIAYPTRISYSAPLPSATPPPKAAPAPQPAVSPEPPEA
ncbi:MAG: mechanosensitive ion channel family protein [Acidobacteriota bacterium]|jgi:MscS family membrane protein|nr:mechanosensitive ion channel family protein [Acidobacteriota bacterium]